MAMAMEMQTEMDARMRETSRCNCNWLSAYVKEIVYGGLDGIISKVAIVTTVLGANLDPALVLIIGISTLIADAISMGVSSYLSETTENAGGENNDKNKKETTENAGDKNNDENKKELLFCFEKIALIKGTVTFASFLILGCCPLISYIPFVIVSYNKYDLPFWISIFLTLITLIILGLTKGKLTKLPQKEQVKYTVKVIVGCIIASTISYGIGALLSFLIKQLRGKTAL